MPFVKYYGRLPYISDDDILVPIKNKDGNMEDLPYRANKYIKRYFKSQNNLTKYLFDNNILTYELISKYTDIEPSRIKSLMKGKLKKVDNQERRQLEIFFNKDFYEKHNKLNEHCSNCKKKKQCGQHYWVNLWSCSRFKGV